MTRRLHTTLILGALAAACGGAQSEAPATPPARMVSPVDAATAGNIAGRITFDGVPPKPADIPTNSDPNCASQAATVPDQSVIVGGNGGLQNVFVYVKDGLGDLRFPVPSTPVLLDQKGCLYVPHVLGIQMGQPLEVANSDPTLHNVHAVPTANREFNEGYPLPGIKRTHTFSIKEVMVPFKCDVHGWMHAYVGVLDHPFFAVTGPDGAFELKGLPPGTYTVEAWHEKLGTQTQTVIIGASETKGDVGFTFKSATP